MKNILVQAIREITNISLDINDIDINIPKKKEHGELSSNIAMKLAKRANMEPSKLGESIKKKLLNKYKFIENIEIMGPGFINFYLNEESFIKENLISVENGDFKRFNNNKKGIKIIVVTNKLSDIWNIESFRAFMNMYYLANIYSFIGYKARKILIAKDYDSDLNIKYLLSNFKDVEIILDQEKLNESITFSDASNQKVFKGIDRRRGIVEDVKILENGFEVDDITLTHLIEKIGLHRIKYTLCSKAISSEINMELTMDELRYIQYPYRRISSVINTLKNEGIDISNIEDIKEELLDNPLEKKIIKKMMGFKTALMDSINYNQSYRLIKYVNELCQIFYEINSTTLFRQLSNEKLVALLKLLDSFKIILKQILDILELPVNEEI